MEDEDTFRELVQRVRQGDAAASTELVSRYEPQVRRLIRIRLSGPMRRTLDSMDICQSVMANFFLRMTAGQFEIESPKQLIQVLATMAKNRLRNHVDHQHAQRRDVRRTTGLSDAGALAESGLSPGAVVSAREMADKLRGELNDKERQLVDLRISGLSWPEIAKQLDSEDGHDVLRQQFDRLINRMAAGLDSQHV